MKNYLGLGVCILSLLGSLGCGPKPTDRRAEVIARVDGKAITAADMDSLANAMHIFLPDVTNIDSLKQVMLDSLVHNALVEIRIDSMKKELDADTQFVERRRSETTNLVFRQMFDNEISAKLSVDSAEIEEYYYAHPDEFTSPEQVRAAHILVAIPRPDTTPQMSAKKKERLIKETERESLKRAKAILAKAKKGEIPWDTLVTTYSEDKLTNQKGGDMGYFARGRMTAEFDSVVFAAPINSIVGPIKTPQGFHVVRVLDRRPPELKPLDDQMRNGIRATVFRNKEREKAQKYVDSLKASAKMVFNEQMLALDDSLVPDSVWMLVINDSDTITAKKMKETMPRYLRYKKLTQATPEVKRDLLKEMSTNYLLRAAGQALGYYRLPEVQKSYDDMTYREAKIRVMRLLRDQQYQPTEEEVENFFNEHFEERFREKKPLHVYHIIFEDSALALRIRDSLVAGADFKEMALRYYPGEPEIREVAYDLGYISEQEMGPEFFALVNQLEPGQISMPIKTQWGYHVVKLVDRRADKTLEQVRPAIRKELTDAADAKVRRQKIDEWRALARIKVDKKALKRYDFPELRKTIKILPRTQ